MGGAVEDCVDAKLAFLYRERHALRGENGGSSATQAALGFEYMSVVTLHVAAARVASSAGQ